jgi:hypothetical protein
LPAASERAISKARSREEEVKNEKTPSANFVEHCIPAQLRKIFDPLGPNDSANTGGCYPPHAPVLKKLTTYEGSLAPNLVELFEYNDDNTCHKQSCFNTEADSFPFYYYVFAYQENHVSKRIR